MLLILVITLHVLPISANTSFFTCSTTGEVDPRGKYAANVALTLSSLTTTTPPTGFSNLTVGDSPSNLVYGLALCRGDVSPSTCHTCLQTSAVDAPRLCPGSASAAVYYDECRLRYSWQPFFSTLVPNPRDPFLFSFRRVTDLATFQDRFGQLMGGLRQRAAFGDGSGLFASGSVEYGLGGADRLYGLVQCTRDLSHDQCAACLDEPVRRVLNERMDSDEITFQGGSCYLRYAFWPFFNASVVAPPATATFGSPPSPPFAAGPTAEAPSPFSAPAPGVADNSTVDTSSPPVIGIGGGGAGKNHTVTIIVAIAIGVAIVAFLLLIAAAAMKKKKPRPIKLGTRNLELQEDNGLKFHRLASKKKNFLKDPRSPSGRALDLQKLDMAALRQATEGFSGSRVIGRSEYGVVYKGELSGREFAIKRITAQPRMGLSHAEKEFKSLSKLQHPNLAKIMVCNMEDDDKFLVYDYYHNTSLDLILFDTKKRVLLDWGRRFKIIEGIGQGLLQLHGDSGMNITHQNLKASNVLLDRQMAPKLSDMCLPAFFLASQPSPGGAKKNGSGQGYMAPEYLAGGISTAKTDVFSYGVLVLEIITGHRNWEFLGPENGTNLLSYVWQYWRDEKALQVLDWSLGELYKAHEVLRCIHVGLLCVQEDPDKRPNMSTVVNMLNSFSFTLPSPSAPPIMRGGSSRRNGSSGLPPPHPNNGNRDWRGATQLSPRTPSAWQDIKLDSR